MCIPNFKQGDQMAVGRFRGECRTQREVPVWVVKWNLSEIHPDFEKHSRLQVEPSFSNAVVGVFAVLAGQHSTFRISFFLGEKIMGLSIHGARSVGELVYSLLFSEIRRARGLIRCGLSD